MSPHFPPASPARWWLRPALLHPALLLLAIGFAASAARAQAPVPPAPRPEQPTWAFGEAAAVRNCLRFTVSDYRDRQGDVDNHDWVHLKVENLCRGTLRNLLVELLLVDAQNRRYGMPVWVIGQGEQLIPGGRYEDDLAIPDPDSRVARRWTMRVLRIEGLPRLPPPPKPQ